MKAAPAACLEAPAPDERAAAQLNDAGIAVVPRYVADDRWRGLARESRRLHARGAFRPAGVGRGASLRIAPEVRSDHVHWIDPLRPSRGQPAWLERMEALRRVLNQRLYLGLRGFETHLAAYAPGSRYRTHRDRFADARHRRVSVLLYLNDDWQPADGGALRLYLEAPDAAPWRDVLPAGGTLVAFLSDQVHHEVRPARRERWSVAGWFTTG